MTDPRHWITTAEAEYPDDPEMQKAFLAVLVAKMHGVASPGYARWQPNDAPQPTKTPPEPLY